MTALEALSQKITEQAEHMAKMEWPQHHTLLKRLYVIIGKLDPNDYIEFGQTRLNMSQISNGIEKAFKAYRIAQCIENLSDEILRDARREIQEREEEEKKENAPN